MNAKLTDLTIEELLQNIITLAVPVTPAVQSIRELAIIALEKVKMQQAALTRWHEFRCGTYEFADDLEDDHNYDFDQQAEDQRVYAHDRDQEMKRRQCG